MSSEDRLSRELEGTGGGYGKFRGMTVRELSDVFDRAATDSNMRAFSAVLRIAREQLEARGSLGFYPFMTGLAGLIGAGLACALPFLPPNLYYSFEKGAIAGGVVFVGFGAGVLKTRKETRAAVAQERAIRDLAIDALLRIATEPNFKAKPLDSDQHRILSELMKKARRKEPELVAMLGS